MVTILCHSPTRGANLLSLGLRVAAPSRPMRSREASTGRDRALQELFLTPGPSECTSLFLVLV